MPYLRQGSLAPIVGRGIYLVERADSASMAAQTLKSAVAALNPTLALRGPNLLSESVDTAMAPTRFRTALMIGFALPAMVLSAVSLYGVIAFAVSQQRQGIGVRIPLDARPGQVVARVLASGMRLAAAGIALGLSMLRTPACEGLGIAASALRREPSGRSEFRSGGSPVGGSYLPGMPAPRDAGGGD